ncbi:MAG: LAGLIDADG family homing endonuclease [Candidatus Paceibacterota bacterium]
MAYILGFIYADGNIVYTKRGTWFWSIQVTDEEIVQRIKEVMNSSHKISSKKKIKNHKQLYRLQVGSKEMCNDLINLGLTERKSKTISFPEIPPKYFCDFLRGYFDGDGGVWIGLKNKKIKNSTFVISTYFTSGSESFLRDLKENLRKKGLQGGSFVRKERGFDLKYSVRDSLNLYRIMYNRTSRCLFLKRKRDKFDRYMKNMRS